MTHHHWSLVGCIWAAMLLLAVAVRGQDTPEGEPPLDETLHNQQPPFLVVAEVNHRNREYRDGEALSVRVASEQDAYVYVLYQQADGKVFQIFPNVYQADNRLRARQTVDIPATNDLFRWMIGPPYGKEVVKVIATRAPLETLADPVFTKGRFNPVAPKAIKGIELELGEEKPVDWAETDIEIHTYARDEAVAGRGARRFGVFIGVSQHQFAEISEQLYDWNPDLKACHRDAQKLAAAMLDIGQLSEARLYTNDQATRQNIEEAITRWLPSVSRPGDTVFIHYSGHTGQLPDDNGDERDGKDEYMLPHDYIDGGILVALREKVQKGEIQDPVIQRRTQQLWDLAVRAGPDRADDAVMRATCVTDDLLARWLQRLSGRQVVLVMDTCHSGGYALDEKSFGAVPRGAPSGAFDFLESELTRLKDIGQKEQALLAAALAAESAMERLTRDMGVMTYCVVEQLQQTRGPVTLEACYEYAQANMKAYFDAINARLTEAGEDPIEGSHPYMVNYCSQTVYLKP